MPFRIASGSPDYTVGLIEAKSWRVHLACDGCPRSTTWGADEIARRFPAHVPIGAVAERLVCACGSREGRVSFSADQVHERRRRLAEFEASGRKIGSPRP